MPVTALLALALGTGWAAVAGPEGTLAGPREETVRRAVALARDLTDRGLPVRWACWSAAEVVPDLAAAGANLDRTWDVAQVHRLRFGGWRADPATAWAAAHDLDPAAAPRPVADDLFDFAGDPTPAGDPRPAGDPGLDDPAPGTADSPVRTDGYLRPEAVDGRWQTTPRRAGAWAQTLAALARRQEQLVGGPRERLTAWSESAAAVLCVELERDGLPLHRARAEQIVAELVGPRPQDEADARRLRALRDEAVWRHVPGREGTDLRNPEQVRGLLAAVGIDVPDTRKHRLAAYQGAHPVVAALLQWRAAERIATTYGYRWLDEHVGPDGRLRGRWTACDGAAGRMTAQNGLHNLPAVLRPAVAAEPGHLLVCADLGQVEPRVLAAVSGDPAFQAATQAPDLYAPVANALGLARPAAKVAVLAAMYGQTSGAAGDALRRLTRAYPQAVGYLDRAYEVGRAGGAIRTYGGRLVATGAAGEWDRLGGPDGGRVGGRVGGSGGPPDDARARARGRFLRNAVIQGAAAELFKAWAATVRVAIRPYDAHIVLCLHDELVVHAPASAATLVAAAVDAALTSAAAGWFAGSEVGFRAATSICPTWADAKT